MIRYTKLPISFNAEALSLDASRFSAKDWQPHFNVHYYEGDWSGIALRAPAEGRDPLFPDPDSAFEDTTLMAACPNVRSEIAKLECEKESVRFLRLGGGARIKQHRDYQLSLEDGVARVHIPVTTNLLVQFYLEETRVEMQPGEAWYLNFNLHHRVDNPSTEPRIHLVVDCIVNDWLRELIESSSPVIAV